MNDGGLRPRGVLPASRDTLGLIHRRISGVEQSTRGGAMIRVDGNPDTERRQHRSTAWQGDRQLHAGDDFFGDTLGVLDAVQRGQQNGELVAPRRATRSSSRNCARTRDATAISTASPAA